MVRRGGGGWLKNILAVGKGSMLVRQRDSGFSGCVDGQRR